MPIEFNPFHKWLGLDPKIRNPHHFQLLGVSHKLTDEAEIQKAVAKAIKRHLVSLTKIPADEHPELLQKMKQRLAGARKVLLDPKLREAYLQKLQQATKVPTKAPAQPGKGRSVKPKMPAPPKPKQPSNQAVDSSPPPLKAASSDDLEPPKPNTSIPMAVPLAGVSQATVPAAVASVPASKPSVVAVNADGVPIDEVKINRKTVKKKRSKTGLIVGGIMLIMAAGGGFLIYQNLDVLMEMAGIKKDAPIAPGIVDDKPEIPDAVVPPIGGKDNPEDVTASKPVAPPSTKLNLDDLPEIDEEAISNHPDSLMAQGRAPRPEKKPDEEAAEDTGGLDVSSEPTEPSGPVVKFDDFQLSKIRRHLERATRDIYRHDLVSAKKSVDYANSVLAEVTEGKPASFEGEQASIAKLVPESAEMLKLIRGFWEQVRDSSDTIPGGQEIVASGQTIGFVEGDSEKVILRHAGSNVTYFFDFCPRSLAVSLAEQGAIPDIPIWNKQLAAFYAIDQLINSVDHEEKIESLLKESEEAGHECEGIRHFASFKFGELGKPAEKIDLPSKRAMRDSIEEFRAENNYKDPIRVEPNVATVLSELLLQIDSPNFEQHVVLLEEARQLGIRSGSAAMTEDAIIELDQYANINAAELKCSSFSEIAGDALTSAQSRRLMEIAIPFLKSKEVGAVRPKSLTKLAKRLMEIAEKENMIDAARRLNQITKD